MKNTNQGGYMLTFTKVDYMGFDFEIEDLFGHATLFIHSNGFDNNTLYKYIDEEHGIKGGGYYSQREAKKDFKNKIKDLVA